MADHATVTNVAELSLALRKVQELRSSVQLVFHHLAEGTKDTNKNDQFLVKLQQNLLTVNRNLSDLEKLSNMQSAPLALGNSALIALDPLIDRHHLYSQLLLTHKWSNKLHDHAALASSILQQNLLKRSTAPGGSTAKKQRRLTSNSHAEATYMVDRVIQNLIAGSKNMTINITRPLGQPAILLVSLAKTLRAVVVLRGLLIEWVNFKAFHEPVQKDNKQVDIWTKSKFAVFQKVTDHATAAMLHFYHPVKPELALKSFMLWLNAYDSLFSAPCHKCGKFLMDNMPPTWRDLRFLDSYHESCRPQQM